MIITKAKKSDLSTILELQYAAFQSEAAIYNDFTIQPLRQTIDEFKDEFNQGIVLKAEIDGTIIGSVRAYIQHDVCLIGKLIVSPSHQNQGIGKKLMNAIEAIDQKVKRAELFTGHKSEKNLALYKKLGYEVYKEEEHINQDLTIVYLCKVLSEVD